MSAMSDKDADAQLQIKLANRFQNSKRLKREPTDPGLELVVTTENGNILMDFGEPVQTVGMTLTDAQAFVSMMLEAVLHVMMREKNPETVN